MSEGETDPKPEGESDDSAKSEVDESAAAAKEVAKDFANNAGAMFQGLDQKMQIYLVALVVTLLCSIFFGAFKTKMKMSAEMKQMSEMAKKMTGQDIQASSSQTLPSLSGMHGYSGAFGGKLAFLGAAAGIGILLWSTFGKRKETWIPLGLAGAAGLAALGILMTRMGMGGGGSFGGTSISINGTILGWWLPLAAAVVATVVSAQRILKA
jgi:hypothetical protein